MELVMYGLVQSCTLLLAVSFTAVEAQQCNSYMGGISSSRISGGIHRYACCEGYHTIQGGGSTEPYCGTDGRPNPEYMHHTQLNSFTCRNVESCMRDANTRYFGFSTQDTPLLCWFYLSNFERCCEPGKRKKRQADMPDDVQYYDDIICMNGGMDGSVNGECYH